VNTRGNPQHNRKFGATVLKIELQCMYFKVIWCSCDDVEGQRTDEQFINKQIVTSPQLSR